MSTFHTRKFRTRSFGPGAGGGPPLWTPLSITSAALINWYYAPTMGYSNLASATTCYDSGPGGNNLTAAGSTLGTPATYKTGQQNGLSMLSFDGSLNAYSVGGSNSLASSTQWSFWAVVNSSNLSSRNTIFGTTQGDQPTFQVESSGKIEIDAQSTTLIASSTSTISAGTCHLLVVTINTVGTVNFYIDGAAAGTPGAGGSFGGTAGTFGLGIYNASSSVNGLLTGLLGECGICTGILGSTDLTQLHSYAQRIWATS